MIKVLWLANIVLPELYPVIGLTGTMNMGGWLTGAWNELKKIDDISLGICCPIYSEKCMKDGENENYKYYSFHFCGGEETIKDKKERFCEILKDFIPDVIHIWGTEYYHTYAMMLACKQLGYENHTIINIQGLLKYCAEDYYYGVPESVVKEKVNGSSIEDEVSSFEELAVYESKSLNMASYISGRTEWDKEKTRIISPDSEYIHCGEILRPEFYDLSVKWEAKKCEKHTIFVSQASYALKGFHNVIPALAELRKKYSDLKVYVSGTDMTTANNSYAIYLRTLIDEYKLLDTIQFIGMRNVNQMIECYLKANVFLSASNIENSPNSICEAMHVGVPVVSSNVGGVASIITDKVDGILYEKEKPMDVVGLISKIFDDDEYAEKLSQNGLVSIEKFNNIEQITKDMHDMYVLVAGSSLI